MEWNQLQKFLVVAHEENISKAALHLNMTQPSLSQTIKRLENELGYQLFDRDGKKIHLNESGQIFLQTVLQMNELMENTKTKLEELNHLHHPTVTILFSTATKQLPDLLLYLKRRNPTTQYRIHQGQRDQELRESDIQLLSSSQSDSILDSDEILLKERILLALPKNHPLQNRQHIYLFDLLQEEFICLNEYWELGRVVKKEMDRMYFFPKETMIVDNPHMMRELLSAHLGIAFVPERSWDDFGGDTIILREVEGFSLKRTIYLRSKARKYLTREQKECIKGIQEYFNQKYHF